jgi:hypothetical protein
MTLQILVLPANAHDWSSIQTRESPHQIVLPRFSITENKTRNHSRKKTRTTVIVSLNNTMQQPSTYDIGNPAMFTP